MRITLTAEFTAAFPEGVFGALVARGCPNRPRATALRPRQREVEARLREQFAARPIEDDAVAGPYAAYFKRWGQRYPVAHQAKTILAGRPIHLEVLSALIRLEWPAAQLDPPLIHSSG